MYLNPTKDIINHKSVTLLEVYFPCISVWTWPSYIPLKLCLLIKVINSEAMLMLVGYSEYPMGSGREVQRVTVSLLIWEAGFVSRVIYITLWCSGSIKTASELLEFSTYSSDCPVARTVQGMNCIALHKNNCCLDQHYFVTLCLFQQRHLAHIW